MACACLLFCFSSVVLAQQDTIWSRRLRGSGNGNEYVQSMTSDVQGNVYAAIVNRWTDVTESFSAIITAKYSTSGQLLWQRRFTGLGDAIPAGIAVDRAGNAFVAASSGAPGSFPWSVAFKYSASGDFVWIEYFTAGGHRDSAAGIQTDSAGNVYVGGTSRTVGGHHACSFIKYSNSGTRLAAQVIDLGAGCNDHATAMALDPGGFVYLAGWGHDSLLAMRFTTDGEYLWRRVFPSSRYCKATAATVDPQGNLLVTGRFANFTDWDSSGILTVKYLPNGDTAWSQSVMAGGMCCGATAVQTDGQSNVVVAGSTTGSTNYVATVLKYAPDGSQLWRYGVQTAGFDDSMAGLAVDPQGNVYAIGSRLINPLWNQYVRVVKLTPTGEEVWSRIWSPTDSGWCSGTVLTLVPGGLCAGGWAINWGRDTNAVLVGYGSEGGAQWHGSVSGPGGSTSAAYDVTFDPQGNVIAAGYLDNTNEAADLAVAKYSAAGELLWQRSYSNIQGGEDVAKRVRTDTAGNVYVTGYSDGQNTATDYVTLKYDATGTLQWVARYDGPAHGRDEAADLAIDRWGNVVVTGKSDGGPTGFDYATVKYSASGQELWVRRYDGLGDSVDYADAAAVDTSGNVYVQRHRDRRAISHDNAQVRPGRHSPMDDDGSMTRPARVLWVCWHATRPTRQCLYGGSGSNSPPCGEDQSKRGHALDTECRFRL